MSDVDPGSGRRRRVGPRAIAEALAEERALRLIVHRDGPLSEDARSAVEQARGAGVRVLCVGDGPIWRLTAGEPETEVLALEGPPPEASLDEVLAMDGAVWLLAGTAYPGNAGFVIRTAEVSGADGVVIDADFDRPKRREALRASMRADRYLPVFFEPGQPVVDRARAAGRRIVAIETGGSRAPWEADLRGPVLFVVGAERSGVPRALLEGADAVVELPMQGFIASYNLQAAMAAVASERLRQESTPTPPRFV
ncbi:MAG: TrmH family RNA methyltransferase [Myxococcota bacterium]